MSSPPISYDLYRDILFAWIILAVIVFFVLLKLPAPYGRHNRGGWGPQVSNRWAWMWMEAPVLIILGYFVLTSISVQTTVTWIMIGLFSFHYFNRVFIFPFRLHTKGKTMPLSIGLSAVFFNLVNGLSFGLFFKYFATYSAGWLMDPRFITGVLIFILGMTINWKADSYLISLRKPGETHYVMPDSGMFRWISCPNLFGELLEWLGFALLCWSLPSFTFFIWTAANLVPRALSHHRWYKEKFHNYPPDRKAIIPYIW